MKIETSNPALTRFLEVKKAAEARLNGAKAPEASKPGAGNSAEAFLSLLSEIRTRTAPETAAAKSSSAVSVLEPLLKTGQKPTAKAVEEAKGLLSVYNINRALGSHLTESEGSGMAQRTRHLGSLFDAVA